MNTEILRCKSTLRRCACCAERERHPRTWRRRRRRALANRPRSRSWLGEGVRPVAARAHTVVQDPRRHYWACPPRRHHYRCRRWRRCRWNAAPQQQICYRTGAHRGRAGELDVTSDSWHPSKLWRCWCRWPRSGRWCYRTYVFLVVAGIGCDAGRCHQQPRGTAGHFDEVARTYLRWGSHSFRLIDEAFNCGWRFYFT